MNSLVDFEKCRTFINDYDGADTKLNAYFKYREPEPQININNHEHLRNRTNNHEEK